MSASQEHSPVVLPAPDTEPLPLPAAAHTAELEPTAITAEEPAEVKEAEAAPVATAALEVTQELPAASDEHPHAAEDAAIPIELPQTASVMENSGSEAQPQTHVEAESACAETPSTPATAPVVTPEPRRESAAQEQQKPSPQGRQGGRFRGFLEEHGYMAASLAVAMGCGWIIGANTFETRAGSDNVLAAVRALDAKIDAMARDDVAPLRAGADQLKAGLDATRNNTATAFAQLTSKFDRLDREHGARIEKFEKEQSARLDRLERAVGSATPTGSIPQIPPPAAPAPVALPAPQSGSRPQAEHARMPSNGYVVRDVRDGAAIVESRAGLREVFPGDTLPGAGMVRAIERRGRQWVVVTTNGVIDQQGY